MYLPRRQRRVCTIKSKRLACGRCLVLHTNILARVCSDKGRKRDGHAAEQQGQHPPSGCPAGRSAQDPEQRQKPAHRPEPRRAGCFLAAVGRASVGRSGGITRRSGFRGVLPGFLAPHRSSVGSHVRMHLFRRVPVDEFFPFQTPFEQLLRALRALYRMPRSGSRPK